LIGKRLQLDTFMIVGGRTFLGALSLTAFMLIKRSSFRLPSKKMLFITVLSGIVLAAHWGTFFYCIKMSNVSLTLMCYASFPIFVTLIDPLFSKKSIKLNDFIISILVFASLMLVLPNFDFSSQATFAVVWGLLAALFKALLQLINKEQIKEIPATTVGMYQSLFAFLVILPFCFHLSLEMSDQDLMLLLVLGIICTGLAPVMFVAALKIKSAQYVAVVASLETPYGVLMAFFILSESLTLLQIVGSVLVVLLIGFHSYRSQKID